MQIRECFAKLMMLKSLFGWASTNCVTTEYNETGNDIMLPTISYYWKWPLALKCSCYGVKNVFEVTRKYYNGINFWPLNRFLLTKVVWYRQKHYQLETSNSILFNTSVRLDVLEMTEFRQWINTGKMWMLSCDILHCPLKKLKNSV